MAKMLNDSIEERREELMFECVMLLQKSIAVLPISALYIYHRIFEGILTPFSLDIIQHGHDDKARFSGRRKGICLPYCPSEWQMTACKTNSQEEYETDGVVGPERRRDSRRTEAYPSV